MAANLWERAECLDDITGAPVAVKAYIVTNDRMMIMRMYVCVYMYVHVCVCVCVCACVCASCIRQNLFWP